MPFRMVVRSAASESELNFLNDGERSQAEQLIADFRSGRKPMEETLTVWHSDGVFRRRWADIHAMWIEEA